MNLSSPFQISLIALTFVLAGIVKGVTGMGLPTVAVGLLGVFMAPVEAAALLIIPSLVTNIWQFVAGPNRAMLIRRLWSMLLAAFVATVIATGLIAGGSTGHAALGLALIAYGIVGLTNVRIAVPRRTEGWLSPLIGAATGAVTGATAVFVIPAAPYLQALGLEKDDLVQALGLSFTVSTFALAAGLASHAAFHLPAAGASVLCTAPALAGMLLGQHIRARINAATFRLVFLIGLIALGADLMLCSIL